MDSANSFSTIKSASAAIAFFHKIIVFTNLPTMAPNVCMMRTTTARNLDFRLNMLRILSYGSNSLILPYSMEYTTKVIVI